jgi:putative hemolysin
METIDIVYIVLFVVCLAAAAFFCSAETAFIGIQKLRLHHLIQSKHPKARAIAKIVAQPEKLLATVLLGINFFETAVATLGTLIAIRLFQEQNLGVAIATIAVTILTLLFAEFIPKSLAARYGEKLAIIYIRPLQIISVPMFPFVWLLHRLGVQFTGMAQRSVEPKPTISEAEFHTAIQVGENEGVVEEAEAEMLHRVFEFTDRPVREIMTPRTELVWVEKGSTLAEFLETYRDSPHSRFPVYEDTTDNVTGILFIKDVLLAEADGTLKMDGKIDDLARDPYFVPETKPMGKLLADMKNNGNRMALVVDEFGGIAGGITMDQLLAEIVGEMGDELAEKEEDIITIDANTFEIDGALRIEDANEELGLGIPEGEYETIAGFVLSHLGRIPKQGENLKYKNLKISVHEMRGMKIDRLLITREQDAAPKS